MVASSGHHGCGETELRVALVDRDDAGHDLGRSVVDVHARGVGDLCERLERDVEAVARRVGAALDERVAAAQFAPLDAGERHRHPLSGLGALDRTVVHLHASYPDVQSGRLRTQEVAFADGA